MRQSPWLSNIPSRGRNQTGWGNLRAAARPPGAGRSRRGAPSWLWRWGEELTSICGSLLTSCKVSAKLCPSGLWGPPLSSEALDSVVPNTPPDSDSLEPGQGVEGSPTRGTNTSMNWSLGPSSPRERGASPATHAPAVLGSSSGATPNDFARVSLLCLLQRTGGPYGPATPANPTPRLVSSSSSFYRNGIHYVLAPVQKPVMF